MVWRHGGVLVACAFSAAVEDFEVWEPVPFRGKQAWHPTVSQKISMETPVKLVEVEHSTLLAKQRSLFEQEYWLMQSGLEVKEWAELIENRSREIRCRKEIFRSHWADQEVAILHLMVFRLVQIQATAGDDSSTAKVQRISNSADAHLPTLPRESAAVEVVVCMNNLKAAAGDFPVSDVLRASTVFTITNICRNTEAQRSPAVLLQQLAGFFALEVSGRMAPRNEKTLYFVVLASNAFFNDIHGHVRSKSYTNQSVAETELIKKYMQLLQEEGADRDKLNVVVGTDRVCRRGQYRACKEAQSPYLHASGLLGSAQAVATLTTGLLELLAQSSEKEVDLNTLLREYASQNREVELVPDRRQVIFGSLTEAIPAERGNWCVASEPCCPISNNFYFLHEAFYGRYTVEDCTLIRKEDLLKPVMWSGDGIAKWMYMLALDSLALSCQAVARLVLLSHPTDLLEKLFSAFEATQSPGSIAPRENMCIAMMFFLCRESDNLFTLSTALKSWATCS
eukprot:symbB.v1.2.031748.t1/scaffold3713.1/size51583/2